MSQVRFLFDECIDPDLISGIIRREPAIEALRVGWDGAPPLGTKDPRLIRTAEDLRRMLVSKDRRTLKAHLEAHLVSGRHTWGAMLIRRQAGFRDLIDDLVLVWAASEAEEWVDTIDFLPW